MHYREGCPRCEQRKTEAMIKVQGLPEGEVLTLATIEAIKETIERSSQLCWLCLGAHDLLDCPRVPVALASGDAAGQVIRSEAARRGVVL